MQVSDFDYQLPEELIAQYPSQKRGQSRLLHLTAQGQVHDRQFEDLAQLLQSGDLLVLNDTRVIPARLFGHKESGGRLEVLLERIIDEHKFIAQIRASRSPKRGQTLLVDGDDDSRVEVLGRRGSFFELLRHGRGGLVEWFEQFGHMPLPPYIERQDEAADQDRYQTVYAAQQGAVAAPTAGLHYSDELLDDLRARAVQIETVTLHVGAGTYQPVRVASLEEHQMHSEYAVVSAQVCGAIAATQARGGRVCAAGTTVVRSLETAAARSMAGQLQPFSGDTDIFIYPGYQFQVVDLLQTNFHLPQSTLLMLVAAFSGREAILDAYQHAIDSGYRFFSYGDTMLLERSS
ncbi:MAG: tRNA preQ1(34) S-adenosylmethionine ribosyltransferase-isomerase QueA [Gammaproteobacteria bacterium]|nr:tRNA preQ1(34) S-adenosylmethionine ribosyltransferase-isomerase QueA [Gammaproteobacteria bacterium]